MISMSFPSIISFSKLVINNKELVIQETNIIISMWKKPINKSNPYKTILNQNASSVKLIYGSTYIIITCTQSKF